MVASCAGGGGSVATVEQAASGGGSLLQMINRLRASEGMSALATDPVLQVIALEHSRDMARNRKLSHTGSDGSRYETRLMAAGLSERASLLATENVAYSPGSGGADRVFRQLGESALHRRNFLQADHNKIGIADVGGYWTIVMANPAR